MTDCNCSSDMYGGGSCRCRCCLDAPDLREEIASLRTRCEALEGAARHLCACWQTEVPSHTLYAAFDNMDSVLNGGER